jgi:exosortase
MPAFITILRNNKIRTISILGILIILSLSLYRNSLSQLAASVIGREDSSHGLFVPFISAFFLWQQRDKIKKTAPEFAVLPGSILIFFSAAMLLAPENNVYTMLSAASFFVMLAGLIMFFFGKKIFKELRLPLFFLMTMIPLPEFLYTHIAEWMRSINTDNAVFVTQLFGVPFERNGYYLQFPDILLSVNESCSGIRYLISYFVFGLAYAFFYKKSIASRILVIASIIPISIFASSLRLSIIFLAVHYIGAWTTDEIPHNFLSWAVFGAVLTAVLLLDWKIPERLPAKEAKN